MNISKARRTNSVSATFEDLAHRLGHLAERHQQRPIAVDAKFGSRDEVTPLAKGAV